MKKPTSDAKSRSLTLHLGKSNIADPLDLLCVDKALLNIVEPKTKITTKCWLIYPKKFAEKNPAWFELIEQGFHIGESEFKGRYLSAVIIIKCNTRYFAITFGYGHNLLEEDFLEEDFGLKVSLGLLDPKSLRNIDVTRLETYNLRKRLQTSHAATLSGFDFDSLIEIVRSVTGNITGNSFASNATGAHSLKFSSKIVFSDIEEKCSYALQIFENGGYSEEFEKIDNMRPVRDHSLNSKLDADLLSKLNDRDIDRIYISPPEILENSQIDGFRYHGMRCNDVFFDPNINDYIYNRNKSSDISMDDLKNHKMGIVYDVNRGDYKKWPIYKCLISDSCYEGRQYFLSEGKWYKVDNAFHDRVQKFYEDHVADINLPTAQANEIEDEYNKRVSSVDDFILFHSSDRHLKCPGERTKIELCDIFDHRNKRLIHVKPYTGGSKSLSQLFKQGEVSGRLLVAEPEFRHEARNKLEEIKECSADVISEYRPEPDHFSISFAIIKGRNRAGEFDIPFFSKVAFQSVAQRLETYGFLVQLGFIERIGKFTRSVSPRHLRTRRPLVTSDHPIA